MVVCLSRYHRMGSRWWRLLLRLCIMFEFGIRPPLASVPGSPAEFKPRVNEIILNSALFNFGIRVEPPHVSFDFPRSALPTCKRMASEHLESSAAEVSPHTRVRASRAGISTVLVTIFRRSQIFGPLKGIRESTPSYLTQGIRVESRNSFFDRHQGLIILYCLITTKIDLLQHSYHVPSVVVWKFVTQRFQLQR